MQRLVLAAIVVVALVALFAVALVGIRRVIGDTSSPALARASGLQKAAFALLGALMVYVAVQGGG
ncbi:MAG: hypothetical protein AAGA87_13690 [Pseudomonadota bacterium]